MLSCLRLRSRDRRRWRDVPGYNPGMSDARFRLRTLFVVIAVIAVAIGGLRAFNQAHRTARISAVKSAYHDGRLSSQSAREYVGDAEFESWQSP